jgi:hypothetical protein
LSIWEWREVREREQQDERDLQAQLVHVARRFQDQQEEPDDDQQPACGDDDDAPVVEIGPGLFLRRPQRHL